MNGGFRLALMPRMDDAVRVEDVRWSLDALDPAARLRCGAFVARDGARVPFRLWRADAPRAAVILLHGAFDYSGAFDTIGPELAAQGFLTFAYDQRGFGATRSRGRWRGKKKMVRDLADAAKALRERGGADLPLFVIGESMGGAVAVHAAARLRSLKLSGIILAAPGAIASRLWRTVWSMLANALRLFGRREVVMQRVQCAELAPASAIRLLSDPLVLRGLRPDLLAGLIRLSVSAVAAARRVRVPALVLAGTGEDLLRIACIRALHDNLRGPKQWELVDEAPHLLLHWERGAEILARAVAFMDGVLQTSRPELSPLEGSRVEACSISTAKRLCQSSDGAM